MTRTTILAATALLLVAPAAAHGAETPPPGGEPKDLVLAEPRRFTLDNGLEAVLVEFGDAPKATVYAHVRAGGLDEGGKTWLASITGDMLKEGTANYSGTELAEAAADMGGDIGISTGDDNTGVTLDVLSEYADEAIGLVAEVLQRPTLPESEFGRIQRDYLRSLAVQRNQPQALATEAFRKLLYGDHPLGRTFPEESQLAGYGIADARQFYETRYGARATRLYVVGRFDAGVAEQAIRAAFADWQPGPSPAARIPAERGEPGVALVERPGAPQSTIRLGLRTIDPSHPDWLPLTVTNNLFGGFFSSRVTANLREDKGYTYSPNSGMSTRVGDAYWVQQADVTAEHTGDSLAELYEELDRLRGEAPGPAEVERVRNYMVGTFTLGNASRFGILGQVVFLDTHGLPREYLTRYVERVMAVDGAKVQAVADRYLVADDMSLAVVGPMEAVRAQLEALPRLRDAL